MELALFNFIHSFAHASRFLDSVAVFLAEYLPHFILLAALFLILREKPWKKSFSMLAFAGLTMILSRGIITEVIRFFYNRERPFKALGFEPLIIDNHPSFPSGHAATFFALAIVMFYFDRRWGKWFFLLAFINGLARIFIGLHWPSDILGGFLVALGSFLIIKFLLQDFLAHHNFKKVMSKEVPLIPSE